MRSILEPRLAPSLLAAALFSLGAGEAAAQCSPQFLGNIAGPAGDEVTDVAVSGDTAYVAINLETGSDQMLIFDVSNPASPVQIGSLAGGFDAWTIQVFGNHVYMATSGGLRVVDVSNPAVPVEVALVDVRGPNLTSRPTGLALSADGMTAYTMCHAHPSNGYFGVVDVSTPASSTLVGTLEISNQTIHVAVTGTTAYVYKGFSGQTWEIDVSVPGSPSHVSNVILPSGSDRGLAIHDGVAYCVSSTAGLRAFTDPGTSLLAITAGNLTFSGDRGYFIDGLGPDLTVVDMSSPATPTVLGTAPATGRGLIESGGRVYVVSVANGVDIYDVTSCGAALDLAVADCQDDADGSNGYQIEVELSMSGVATGATGFAAFLDYDPTMFMYRGDLSSYTATPFPLHITPIGQGDDGLLELDGSVDFGDGPTTTDALLATLVFDALVECDLGAPLLAFETGGAFISKLSLDGEAVPTTLNDPEPVTLDDTAPVFDPYADITQAADASASDACLGAVVTFTDPTATDTCDPSPVIVSAPASGSLFPVGTTTVMTTATDACGNSSMTTFDVIVTPTNVVSVDVELVGVNEAVMRCIHLAADDCSFADVTLSFVDHDGDDADEDGIDDTTAGGTNDPSTPVRAIADIEVPCGQYTFLCAKDQQHTQWATSSLSLSGVQWTMDATASLDGGDTDDDGDVDIDDVTWFLFQYGDTASFGGCPWDGTRDADFSNNGAVGPEDYSFLTANWLALSECLCTLPSMGPTRAKRAATTPLQRAADLSGDGWVDAEDVAIFERRNGLPDSLSRKMRGL